MISLARERVPEEHVQVRLPPNNGLQGDAPQAARA